MKTARKDLDHDGLRRVRAAMILRGTSLARWSLDRNLYPRTVISAIRGERRGPVSLKILDDLRREGAL